MGTELLGFEAALYHLLRVGPTAPSLTPPALWPAILTLADREHVAPLVHAAIDASGAAVPDSVRQVLAQSYRRAGTAIADAYAQLAEVLRALHRTGVDPVLLKGPALARFTYADAALRPFGDLDILVRPEHVEAAHHALRGAGYTIAGDRPSAVDITWRHARGYAAAAGRRIPVDLHWRYDGYPLLTAGNYAGVFARAHPVDVDGERALIPAPEDMLLALGIHFARDLWYGKPRLRYVRDTAEVAQRQPVRWPDLQDRVREIPLARSPLHVMLEAARQLLGAGIPEEPLRRLSSRGRTRLRGFLVSRSCRGLLRQDRPADAVFQIALMRWLDAPSVLAYARWLRGVFFVPTELAPSRRRWLRGFWARRPPGVDLGG